MVALLHLILGALGALLILAWVSWRSRERSPAGLVGVAVVATACAILAHNISPWATPLVLALYLLASLREQREMAEGERRWWASQAASEASKNHDAFPREAENDSEERSPSS